ncbi:sulfur carrier protein ThiS [Allosaccharopolyspora coralli]|uniref:Sulfur carrier protein ThiS n=1 Tax=Allosaccharopolyspora coralli TaxID=2665642 RepID=A0A5Q3Q1R1_9PSEU|nr:sulfur carrier protein ThiS [Allosaccharopolyspora coralli]QGK68518.1 sulfur carrier protein ThiS [Allosaccharopolyspora coralli]
MTITINGADHGVEADSSLATILAAYGVAEKGVAVAVDGAVVPRASWQDTIVPDGAAVEVLTAVQGG